LIGLIIGPNLAFTGSLSAYLWYHAARTAGVRPSLKESSKLGLVLVPLTISGALAALALDDPSAF
jgi:arsenical pump membrane protein